MKQISIIAIILFITALMGCYRDKGNYEYWEINEVTISNINSSYSRVRLLDDLKIEPVIAMTDAGKDSSTFDYYWIVMKSTFVIDTIGNSKTLNYTVDLPADNYTLFFRMVDKETKVSWKSKAGFTVGTPYSRGLLLMGEDEQGNAEADIISMVVDTVVLKGLMSASGLPAMQGPYNILHTGGSTTYMKLWALTNTGAYYLDRTTLKATPSNNFTKIVHSTEGLNTDLLRPILVAPQINDKSGTVGSTAVRAMLTSDGNIFTTTFSSNGGDVYGNPVNRNIADNTTRLKAAPYLMYPIGGMTSMVWYDTENHRFMYYPNFTEKSSVVMTDQPDDPFPWNQAGTGRKLVYAENTRNSDGGSANGNSFAIMKDDNNKFFIYKFLADGLGTAAKRDFYAVQSMATDFDKADFYAFSSKRTVIFYAVGSRLYAYDYNTNNEKIYQFSDIGSDEITMLKFDTQIDHITNSLYVGTYNSANKGMLKQYLVGTDPNFVDLTAVPEASWSGLVKIKSMNWRAVN